MTETQARSGAVDTALPVLTAPCPRASPCLLLLGSIAPAGIEAGAWLRVKITKAELGPAALQHASPGVKALGSGSGFDFAGASALGSGFWRSGSGSQGLLHVVSGFDFAGVKTRV